MVVEPCHLCQNSKGVLNPSWTIFKKKKSNNKKNYSVAVKLHFKYKINPRRT